MDEVVAIVQMGKTVVIPISGTSMLPFLREKRDQVRLEALNPQKKITRGDILLFVRESGNYVLHRVIEVDDDRLIMLGDNQLRTEEIYLDQVRAYVCEAYRKGRWIQPKNLVWKFYSSFWNHIWIRKLAGKIGRVVSKLKDKQK